MKMIIAGAAIGAALLSPAGASACNNPPRPGSHDNSLQANANTTRTCQAIYAAISRRDLASHGSETEIKLDAAKQGVPASVRDAIDTYYRGDHAAGQAAMTRACRDAGVTS